MHPDPTRLPTGTVTFLFTDIEGSTPLWEQHPDAMKTAVALHHAVLRSAAEAQGGVVFKVIGDAFQIAFAVPAAGLRAAIAAQHALRACAWPAATGPLAVRMGLHVGPAEVEGPNGREDYAVSHTLNRAARIMSAGRGGQILLSREAADLVERDLPSDLRLDDLGEHQLKGLSRPERLYQASAPGLPHDFPRLETELATPHNLPAALTSFIGRESELESLQRLVAGDSARLVTLTGPGGTGKTRLALEAAAGLMQSFRDGIRLVELAPLSDPALIPQTVATVLGVHESTGKSFTQVVIEHLRGKRLLLILDNCEHVVEAAAAWAEQLLQACQHLHILATSREILGTPGETPFRVPSLALPAAVNVPFEALARCESVRLFVERARTALPTFALTEANAASVRRICQRLDGIPLAIELAAARVRVLSVDEIAARLDDSFRLLTGGSRTVLSRHQTLRALIDWSYNLLTPPERTLFLRLSVFAGGFTLAAAESICADSAALDRVDILDLLAQLVDKSLVIPVDAAPTTAAPTGMRYRLLETIRQYARDRLHDAGGGSAVRDRHLDYFLRLAEEAEPQLRRGEQVAWLDRLEGELDNVRLALEWSLAARVDDGLRLAGALLWFWHIRGHRNEGIDWVKQLVAAQGDLDGAGEPERHLIRGRAFLALGFLTQFQNQPDQGQGPLRQAIQHLSIAGRPGRLWLGAASLFTSKAIRDLEARRRVLNEVEPLLREVGDDLYLAEYYMDLSALYTEQNRMEDARAALLDSLTHREACHDLDGLGTAALGLGDLALLRHDYDECHTRYEQGLEYFRVVGNRTMESILLSRLGQTDMLTGDMAQAAIRFTAGVTLNQQSGDRVGLANSLFDLGRLELNTGEPRRAAVRFAEIVRLGGQIGLQEAVLVGLLFQGLAARESEDDDRMREYAHRAIAFWRGQGVAAFSPEFVASNLDNLAVLLAREQPDVAARLFAAVDRAGTVNRSFNTPHEIAIFSEARARVRASGVPAPDKLHRVDDGSSPARSDADALSLRDAVALAFSVIVS